MRNRSGTKKPRLTALVVILLLVLSPDWPFQRPALENLARPPKNHFA